MLELARERALHGEAHRQRVAAESAATSLAERLAGLDEDLATARASLAALAEERNTLQQALADVSEGRTHDAAVITGLRARLEQVERAADAVAGAPAAVETERLERDTLQARVASAESARNSLLDDERRLRLEHEQLQARHAALEREHETAAADLHAAVESDRATTQELATLQHNRNDAMLELARERALHGEAHRQRVAAESAATSLAERLAGLDEDLATARASLAALAEERGTLQQALADASDGRTHDAAVITGLRARLEQVEAASADARAAADAVRAEAAALRAAVETERLERDTLQARVASAESARNSLLDDERRLRDQVAQAHARVADHRQRVAELEAEREHLRDALTRADAGAQLIASRHLDERDAVQRALDELRGAFAEAEARWSAQRAEVEHRVGREGRRAPAPVGVRCGRAGDHHHRRTVAALQRRARALLRLRDRCRPADASRRRRAAAGRRWAWACETVDHGVVADRGGVVRATP